MSILWDDDLATGNARIDDQHKMLVAIFNSLYGAIAEGRGHEEVGRALSSLTLYVVAHFALEESLMDGYPGQAEHLEAHRGIRARVETLVEEFNGPGIQPGEVIDLLNEWVVTHVKSCDQELVRWLDARAETIQPS